MNSVNFSRVFSGYCRRGDALRRISDYRVRRRVGRPLQSGFEQHPRLMSSLLGTCMTVKARFSGLGVQDKIIKSIRVVPSSLEQRHAGVPRL